ncbi:MAG: hypothetical protein IJT94_06930 [Oscillibacter sp.]|nr:hypothetical protein [Oscillibacter sp.]
MKVVKMPLSALKLPERNVRMHTETQLKEFERSISMFGQIRPIVIDEDGRILAGNGLYETLKRMGRDSADVLKVTGLSENQKKKLMLADNKIFGLGVDDLSAFDAFLADLKDDLDIPGFDEDLLRSMAAEANAVTEQLQEYGTLDAKEIEDIKAAGERKETYMATGLPRDHEPESGPESVPENAAPQQFPLTVGKSEDTGRTDGEPVRRSVVCPHCGGTVWL